MRKKANRIRAYVCGALGENYEVVEVGERKNNLQARVVKDGGYYKKQVRIFPVCLAEPDEGWRTIFASHSVLTV